MATKAAGFLLDHTGASVHRVLGVGQFGSVLLIHQPPPTVDGNDTTTKKKNKTQRRPHHSSQRRADDPPEGRLYAAKIVLLERKRTRSESRTGRTRSGSLSSSSGRMSRDDYDDFHDADRASSPFFHGSGDGGGGGGGASPSGSESGSGRGVGSYAGMRTPTPTGGGGSGSFNDDDDPAISSLFREIDMLSSLRPDPSCNVVQYIGTRRNYECVALLYEYMPGGSVKDLLERDGPILPMFGVGKVCHSSNGSNFDSSSSSSSSSGGGSGGGSSSSSSSRPRTPTPRLSEVRG